jgi:outer membrane protein OmpA-like peptidoglycan-associated protein
MFSKQEIKIISRRSACILLVLLFMHSNKTYGQTDKDLPIIEDFETDSAWVWKPWENRGNRIAIKTRYAAHSGGFGLHCKNDGHATRMDKQIGLPGEAISWWVRFQNNTRANCGFGITTSRQGYYLCVDPSTNTLHFAKSPDYTYPLLKVVNQKYKLNIWYRVEVTFNTTTNVTGKLYGYNGTTLLNTITVDIPDLSAGGIAFDGLALYVDDIRGGTRLKQAIADSPFAPKLGTPLILKNIVFEVNKSNLLQQSFVELDKLVAYLKRNPALKINIVGHTDAIGKEEANKNLSEARAKVVADYLIKHGINKNNISFTGLGSSHPIATNATEEGRKKNRRVECVISNK